MGINSSGVRQIAEAAGSGETERIARTAAVLRRTSMALGPARRRPARRVPPSGFGVDVWQRRVRRVLWRCCPSRSVFRSISDGQAALIQGMRRIADLARIGVLAALFGTAISLALVYFLREDGVVPSLVAVAAHHARHLLVVPAEDSRSRRHRRRSPQVREEAGALLKLGFAFMASAVLTTGAAYADQDDRRDSDSASRPPVCISPRGRSADCMWASFSRRWAAISIRG